MVLSRPQHRCSFRSAWSAALALAWVVGATRDRQAQLPRRGSTRSFPAAVKRARPLTCTDPVGRSRRGQSAGLQSSGHHGRPKTRDAGGHQEPVDNTFVVTIGPNVPSGVYEVYAGGLFGLSNPRIFIVGSQPEAREVEPNNGFDRANELPSARSSMARSAPRPISMLPLRRQKGAALHCVLPRGRHRLEAAAGPRTDRRGRTPARLRAAGTRARSARRRRAARRRDLLSQGLRLSLSRRCRIWLPVIGRFAALHRFHHAARGRGRLDREVHAVRPQSARGQTVRRESRRAPARKSRG